LNEESKGKTMRKISGILVIGLLLLSLGACSGKLLMGHMEN
jgi:hypothetical protein